MSSCCGGSRKKTNSAEAQPLLAQYDDDTTLQRTVHQKLHTYQMLRALGKGFMPSTEQVTVNLRTLLASDILNAETPGLTDSGRQLVKYTRLFLTDFVDLLKNKNDEDQIQDFIWYMLHARMSVDVGDLVQTASNTRAKADASAAIESIKTVGSLLATNSDFRLFLSDLNTIGRQVFSDTANTLSEVAGDAAKQLEPSNAEIETAKNPDKKGEPVTKEDLKAETAQISNVVADGLKKTGQEATVSLKENITEDKDSLLTRLRAAVVKLRKRNDYSDSVSTIGFLIQRYAKVYSRAVDDTISAVQEDVHTNAELDRAIKNGWLLLSSFGDKEAWNELEQRFNKVMEHSQKDPEFENMMGDVAASVQKMLSDPDFYDSAREKVEVIKEKSAEIGTDSPLKKDVERLLVQSRVVFDSVVNDKDVAALMSTMLKLWGVISPLNNTANSELLTDAYNVFLPLAIRAIQYIPIPRLEVSTPEIDLLLENLILEPGKTVNHTSFFPHQLSVKSFNDLSIRAARFQTLTTVSSVLTISLRGLCIRAEEVGFWLRTRTGLFGLADAGIASFALDDRGVDITLDVEIARDALGLEQLLVLRKVHVQIHKLDYTLRQSKFACLAWMLTPILRPILRKTLEHQIAQGIADFFHAANRELVFARERLRATRIADPKDLLTFVKAIAARLTPADDPDVFVGVGVRGGVGSRSSPFKGVYAPGSVVKLWEEEARQATERVEENEERGKASWRNEIFDVKVTSA